MKLTKRLKQILELIAEGKTNKVIGGICNINLRTVSKHRDKLHKLLEVHSVGELIHRAHAENLIAAPAALSGVSPLGSLSKRELEILKCFGEGRYRKEIAARLSISSATVNKHFEKIYKKLHLTGSTQSPQVSLMRLTFVSGVPSSSPITLKSEK